MLVLVLLACGGVGCGGVERTVPLEDAETPDGDYSWEECLRFCSQFATVQGAADPYELFMCSVDNAAAVATCYYVEPCK